jgi:hypothetical protein
LIEGFASIRNHLIEHFTLFTPEKATKAIYNSAVFATEQRKRAALAGCPS